jgi:hypothetical protein
VTQNGQCKSRGPQFTAWIIQAHSCFKSLRLANCLIDSTSFIAHCCFMHHTELLLTSSLQGKTVDWSLISHNIKIHQTAGLDLAVVSTRSVTLRLQPLVPPTTSLTFMSLTLGTSFCISDGEPERTAESAPLSRVCMCACLADRRFISTESMVRCALIGGGRKH